MVLKVTFHPGMEPSSRLSKALGSPGTVSAYKEGDSTHCERGSASGAPFLAGTDLVIFAMGFPFLKKSD